MYYKFLNFFMNILVLKQVMSILKLEYFTWLTLTHFKSFVHKHCTFVKQRQQTDFTTY